LRGAPWIEKRAPPWEAISFPENPMIPLHDAHGRRFHTLRLSLTEACNFRCGYCLPDGYRKPASPENPLAVSEIVNLVAAFASMGLRKVRLTGGEPTLRRDFTDIVLAVRAVPGVETVAMTTNGHDLRARAFEYRCAGVDAVNVSVDSLDRARFREATGTDRLDEVLAGVENALAAGMRVKLNAVLLRGLNDDELGSFLEFVRARAVTARFIELMRTDERAKFFEERRLSSEVLERELRERGWIEAPRETAQGPAREFRHHRYLGRVGLIAPYREGFCGTCNRLRVSSTGDLRLCLFGEGRYPLRELLRSPDQRDELVEAVRAAIGEKPAAHLLHQGNSGKTRYLAEIGG
jgi:cyclic pyranopterin phosphate synthase